MGGKNVLDMECVGWEGRKEGQECAKSGDRGVTGIKRERQWALYGLAAKL